MFRIGHGYDVHKLCADRKLVLGGVNIPHSLGLLGHSDADVLVHALCDALLGAAALGDIGIYFPDTSDEFKDVDSRILLRRVVALLEDKNYSLVNADITVIAQKPKLSPFISQMVENLASDCGVCEDCINVKATTEEKLGFTGEEKGISAHAVCLIERK